jgi:hypothetical protein
VKLKAVDKTCLLCQRRTLQLVSHECLAQAIVASSLKKVTIRDTQIDASALARTTPINNLDFTFSQDGNDTVHLQIKQKWKLLLNANVPLGLWPRILAKAHTFPETSHGPQGILFLLLKDKADLIPRTSLRKRTRED